MSFSRQAWVRIAPLFERMVAMPFNHELGAGTLERRRFLFYMQQDALYLSSFGRTLAAIAARAPDNAAMIQLAGSARECLVVERELHERFFAAYGITPETAARTKASPTCAHYVSYLLATAYNAPYEVAIAAVLPCFWIYAEIGKILLASTAADNPYQPWIDTYVDEAFEQGVIQIIAICDQAAAATTENIREQMLDAFVTATRLEWMFWDSAYRMEPWPVM